MHQSVFHFFAVQGLAVNLPLSRITEGLAQPEDTLPGIVLQGLESLAQIADGKMVASYSR
jgi:hypothetical protein